MLLRMVKKQKGKVGYYWKALLCRNTHNTSKWPINF